MQPLGKKQDWEGIFFSPDNQAKMKKNIWPN